MPHRLAVYVTLAVILCARAADAFTLTFSAPDTCAHADPLTTLKTQLGDEPRAPWLVDLTLHHSDAGWSSDITIHSDDVEEKLGERHLHSASQDCCPIFSASIVSLAVAISQHEARARRPLVATPALLVPPPKPHAHLGAAVVLALGITPGILVGGAVSGAVDFASHWRMGAEVALFAPALAVGLAQNAVGADGGYGALSGCYLWRWGLRGCALVAAGATASWGTHKSIAGHAQVTPYASGGVRLGIERRVADDVAVDASAATLFAFERTTIDIGASPIWRSPPAAIVVQVGVIFFHFHR